MEEPGDRMKDFKMSSSGLTQLFQYRVTTTVGTNIGPPEGHQSQIRLRDFCRRRGGKYVRSQDEDL